jgi:hypothetical protein
MAVLGNQCGNWGWWVVEAGSSSGAVVEDKDIGRMGVEAGSSSGEAAGGMVGIGPAEVLVVDSGTGAAHMLCKHVCRLRYSRCKDISNSFDQLMIHRGGLCLSIVRWLDQAWSVIV